MNINKLFGIQKILRDRINYTEPDRFNKLILALLVELGECANELPEIFKFWSKGKKNNHEKALKEYVDGLHFVFELGLELDYIPEHLPGLYHSKPAIQFIDLYYKVSELNFLVSSYGKEERRVTDSYQDIFDTFLHIGRRLGFTWEQIEQAYVQKNEVNHLRQDNGY
ncbi:dUTP diphosphatase [Robertmurraya korlensis]|uniref:dUTP diphosphatase n=1 Tax=Robertmurraya korlensis TaxID=519977 RepID=UPI00203D0C4D|nr:dUTP diphosphatase [Robertmurraya korlensis]MCM3600654.1 dUTP diphosphatase [Robertmurraya korlensis]